MALDIFRRRDVEPAIKERHEPTVEMNQILAEYGELFEGVATDRAALLLAMTKLRLENAELEAGRDVITDLQAELNDLRTRAGEYRIAVRENKNLLHRIEELEGELLDERRAHGVTKGQLTRLRNRLGGE